MCPAIRPVPRGLMRPRFGPLAALLPILGCLGALATPGCDYLEDRFQTCGNLRVDLANSMQSPAPIHIAAENESFSASTRLLAGATRRLVLCVERGNRKRFRAMQEDGNIVAQVTCVVSRGRYEYESSVARVEWNPGGLHCQDW